jgi:hypothetical protein
MARTSTYSEFEDGVKALIGIDDLQTVEQTQLNAYFNKWIRLAWERWEWPEVITIEERTPDSNGLIDYEQGGETAISGFFNIYDVNPRSTQVPQEYTFELDGNGANLIDWDSDSGTVFVRFRTKVSTYTTVGTQTIPYIFLPYLINVCYADWLKAEGQHGKAQMAMDEAEQMILFEIEKFERQQNQQQPVYVTTHGSTQYRIGV